jgi:hypothetical protein
MSSRSQRLAEAGAERRSSNRLPIERAVRYKVYGDRRGITHVGTGKTLNMSSRGVLFTTETILPRGARIELTVSWPAKLDDAVPLNLVAMGIVVRTGAKEAAIAMEKYEFRTRGAGVGETDGYREVSRPAEGGTLLKHAGPLLHERRTLNAAAYAMAAGSRASFIEGRGKT